MRVVFGVRAKLHSGFHFMSGSPSTILLWSVMDFLPPSCYRLSLSPNVYCTQGRFQREERGRGSRQGRYSTWDTFIHRSHPFLSCFFFVSSLFFFSCATYRVYLDRLDHQAPRLKNPKRKCFRFVREVSIILSYWLAFILRNFFLPFCKLFSMKIRFIPGFLF